MKKNNKKDMFGFCDAINWKAVDKALADPEKRKVLENILLKDEKTKKEVK